MSVIDDSHLFRSLDPVGREKLLDAASVVHFGGGRVIVREGDLGCALFLVKEGRVRITMMIDGEIIELARLGRGGCFGEVAVLSQKPRTATVVADEDCTLLRFSREAVEDVLNEYPKVMQLLESLVQGRARDTIEKIMG
ncbi:MAG: cyclic nucleotide-binding domain-containing protein [Deltaproteobacteria bacterium]|nr:cyclic nucleotide-binding domain-containing protein [Deltaproteobacteria bacterium]